MKLFDIKPRTGLTPASNSRYSLESYARVYWRAAKLMAENKLFASQGSFGAFPVVFLYRHALELILKAILIDHHKTYSREPKKLFKRGHHLQDYVADLRSVVEAVGHWDSGEPVIVVASEEWQELETVLREWQEIDPDSMAFRYSVNKKTKKISINPKATFNMNGFTGTMETILEFLFDLKKDLDELRDAEIASRES